MPPSSSENIILLKELSDIKEKLATNTEKTTNAVTLLTDLKQVVSDLPSSFIARKEYDARHTELEVKITNGREATADHEVRIRSLEKNVWKAIGALAILQVAIPLLLKYLHL